MEKQILRDRGEGCRGHARTIVFIHFFRFGATQRKQSKQNEKRQRSYTRTPTVRLHTCHSFVIIQNVNDDLLQRRVRETHVIRHKMCRNLALFPCPVLRSTLGRRHTAEERAKMKESGIPVNSKSTTALRVRCSGYTPAIVHFQLSLDSRITLHLPLWISEKRLVVQNNVICDVLLSFNRTNCWLLCNCDSDLFCRYLRVSHREPTRQRTFAIHVCRHRRMPMDRPTVVLSYSVAKVMHTHTQTITIHIILLSPMGQ